MNIYEYPKVLSISRQRQIRWAIKEKPWYVFEENFNHNDDMLGQVAQIFSQYKGNKEEIEKFNDAAFSFIIRYDLLNKNIANKNQLKNSMKKKQNYSLLINPIFEKDLFNPMEENIGVSPLGSFINLKDFGILENNVFFIDDHKQSTFLFAKESLETSDIVIKFNFISYYKI